MARRKNYYAFTDFNYTDGAAELFNNTIRNAFEYDAFNSDIFTAKVLHAAPTQDPEKSLYRIRIMGALSPHRFIEDPCSLSSAIVEDQKQIINNLLSLHTKLISTEVLDKSDIIKVRLNRSGQSFDLVEAAQLVSVERRAGIDGHNLDDSELAEFTSCSELFDKASILDESVAGDSAPVPIGEPIDQAALDIMMDNFYGTFRGFLIRQGYKSADIGNGSRSRTTLEGRQMIMRFAQDYGLPEAASILVQYPYSLSPPEGGKRFSNLDETVLTKELTETIRKKLKTKGLKIAQPELSSHNPNNGYVAMDFQLLNQPKPSFALLADLAERFKSDDTYSTMHLELYRTVLEPTNGNAKCGTGKCGVVHFDMLPTDAVSAEYMRNYSTVNPYVEVAEDEYADPDLQSEIDELYPPEDPTSDPFAPIDEESATADPYATSPS